jgi:hypothetical protein
MFITGVNDTSDKLFTSVNDTGDKFIAGDKCMTQASNPVTDF